MISDNWKEQLLKRAHKQCVALNIKLSTLGSKVVGDADFFVDLEKNPEKGCNSNTLVGVKHWFRDNPIRQRKK
jgi:hypothetical protein